MLVYKRTVIIAVLFIVSIFLMFLFFQEKKPFFPSQGPYVSFDESMQLDNFPQIVKRPDFSYVYNFFKSVYDQNSFAIRTPEKETRIPKIIHIMWLGGKLPQEFEPYVQSWAQYHPDWTILFWTDNHLNYDQGNKIASTFDQLQELLKLSRAGERIVIDTHKLLFDNKKFYDEARNYGEKSDILKWEIVYRFGGVYVDTDFECLQALDLYHHTYDFYTGIQPLDTNMVQLGAALYGAIPNHPILKACVENIKNNQDIKQIVVKTGPIHFTKTFLAVAGTTGLIDVAFPSSYFYPCGYEQKGMPKDEWCHNESSAVHHWAGSWLKPEAFAKT